MDYSQLLSKPKLRSSFETTVKKAIASEAGHGITPSAIDLALQPGSVVVLASIQSLQQETANAVVRGFNSSTTLSKKLVDSVRNVDGMAGVCTGHLTITSLGASLGSPLAAQDQLGPSTKSMLFILFFMVGGICIFLACLLFFVRIPQQGLYVKAQEDVEAGKSGGGSSAGAQPLVSEEAQSQAKSPSRAKQPPPRWGAAYPSAGGSSTSLPTSDSPSSGSTARPKGKARPKAKSPPLRREATEMETSSPAGDPVVAKASPKPKPKTRPRRKEPSVSYLRWAVERGFSLVQARAAFAESGENEEAAKAKLSQSLDEQQDSSGT